MKFKSRQIHGRGKGHSLGYPTINLSVPEDFTLPDGIYAACMSIRGNLYRGALYFGRIPTFGIVEETLEIYLLGLTDETVPVVGEDEIEVETFLHVREPMHFATLDLLSVQIGNDVAAVADFFESFDTM
jgi:riboflavin kinase / FMN adenylyltransferase